MRRSGAHPAAGGRYRGGAPPACHHLPERGMRFIKLFMSFYSLPYEPRKLQATEARLEAIYDAAKMGLKGDTLAIAAGMLPAEYRQLCQFDPLAELAEQKGRADGELTAARTLHQAAADGDAKAALDILKHQHGWKAAQSITIDIEQRISITGALEKAQARVIEGLYSEVESAPTLSHSLTDQQERIVDGYRPNNARSVEKSTDL